MLSVSHTLGGSSTKGRAMRNRRSAVVLALVSTALISTVLMGPLAAQEDPPPAIAVELLTPRTGGEFTDQVSLQFRFKLEGDRTRVINSRDPSQTIVAKITVQPWAPFPWHTHPGPVVVNVAEGHLTYVQADDCVHRPYPAGTAFIDPGGGNVHSAYAGPEGAVVVATFFDVPAEGPLTIAADAPEDCVLEVGAHG